MTLQSVQQEKQENHPSEGTVAAQEWSQARSAAAPYDHFQAHWSDRCRLYLSLYGDLSVIGSSCFPKDTMRKSPVKQ